MSSGSELRVVKGNTVRARHMGHDMIANLKNIVGGEIDEYTKLMAESREQAIDRMMQSARELGATPTENGQVQSQAGQRTSFLFLRILLHSFQLEFLLGDPLLNSLCFPTPLL